MMRFEDYAALRTYLAFEWHKIKMLNKIKSISNKTTK